MLRVEPMCCLRAECAFIYFWVSVSSEHLVGIGTVPTFSREKKRMPELPVERGGERRKRGEKRRESQRQRGKMNGKKE